MFYKLFIKSDMDKQIIINRKGLLNKIKIILIIFLVSQISCQPPSGESQITVSDSFIFQEQDITQVQQGYNDGTYTIKEVVQAYLDRIEELIAFNQSDSIELKYFNQKYLEMAHEKGDLTSVEYVEALAKMKEGSRKEGIDRVMNLHNLDAIIAPTGSPAWKTDLINGDSFQLGSSSPAARAGYPNITVPMGYVDELPVGISFFGRAWSEPVLLEIAYAYERGTKHRKSPEFLVSE